MAGFTLPITLPLSWQSARSAQFWAGQDRRIYARFWVSRPDGVTWTDLTSYLVSVRISLGNVADVGTGNSGVDTGVRQATFELINDRPTVDSLHPRDRLSSWNTWGGVYAPLLWPTREVVLEVAAVPVGVTPGPADWVRVFHGFMGDSISASSDNGRITIECRDLMKRLADTYIETVREYGSEAGTPAETVMQQIINDNVAHPPTLYVPVSPGFMVRPYKCEYQSVADALWQVVNQFGGWLGYKWTPDCNDFRLTLLIPPRGKDASCADWTLDWSRDIYIQHLDISDRDVRNAVVVTYRDSATRTRQWLMVEDAASIAEYGRRAMQIEEADTSLIDTAAEATALAQVVLHDLKDLTATTRINMPFMPTMDVFDGIVVRNPRLSSTEDFYAVESVEHVLDFDRGQFRTEVIASGRVIGAHTKWLLMETRPGSPGKPTPLPVTWCWPAPPTNVRAQPGPGSTVAITWDPSPDPMVNEYEVWRKQGVYPNDPTGAQKLADEAGTAFVDATGTPGTTYTWYVKAVNIGERASGFSVGAYATVPVIEVGPDTTPPGSLASIGLTVSGQTLYQDAQGNWFVKATLALTNIPADAARAYVQIKHRRTGSETWKLDDQLAVTSGNATASVDDLLPNITYEFAAVPVSYYGVEGTGKTVSATTPKDGVAPSSPTFKAYGGIVKGIYVELNTPAEADWDGFEIHISESGSGFTPGASTLRAQGKQTRFEITGLVPGRTYYVKAISYDTSGNKSSPAY